MNLSSKTRVAVLRGGPSYTYEGSLKTGAYVLSLLREMPEAYEPMDVFISRDGEWHHKGLAENPHRILSRANVVWNALHGPYGEDGKVQQLLEALQVPYTGSSILSSAFSTDKEIAKKFYRQSSIPTPQAEFLTEDNFDEEKLIKIFRNYLHPVVVKPAHGARGLGIRIAHTFNELKDAVKKTFAHSPKVQIEEYIAGRVSSCTVIENAKGERLYTLMPTGKSSSEEKRLMQNMARLAHEALHLRHYSSSDFIITPKGRVYILETNSLPALHENSLMHNSLKATGWQPRDFADHCLRLALNRLG